MPFVGDHGTAGDPAAGAVVGTLQNVLKRESLHMSTSIGEEDEMHQFSMV